MQPTDARFTLLCEVGGPLGTFSAPATVDGILTALRALPVPVRFGLSENVMQCMAEHAVRHPGEPACYGETLTLFPGVSVEVGR